MQPVSDYILIKAETRYENSLKIKGENGQEINLEIDGELEDKQYRCWGTVVAVPTSFTSEKRGTVLCSDIVPVVEVGDKIYFDFHSLSDSTEVAPQHYALVYSNAICIVRNGEIIPVGSHVLLSPVYPDDVKEVQPGIMGRENSLGMITEINVPPLKGRGIIAHVAHPLKSEAVQMQAGQKAILSKHYYANWYSIEGNNHMVCRQKDVDMVERVNS